jgi:lipoprotein signal peptidase
MKSISQMFRNKMVIVGIAIIIIDLATKLLANWFLPFKENVPLLGEKFSFYLIYNEGSTGGQANALIGNMYNKNLLIISACISVAILMSYILYIRKRELKTFYKILIGIGLYLVLSVIVVNIQRVFVDVNISNWLTSVIGKIFGLAIWGTVAYLIKNDTIRFPFVLVLAAGVGNLLSHFYPPFLIIDFIYIEGLSQLVKIGVFNFADLAFDIGIIWFIIALIIIDVKKAIQKCLK